MNRPAIDIDKIAREAMKEHKPLSAKDVPIRPMFYFLLVEPLAPKKQVGSIIITDQTKEIESIQTTVGRVLSIGSLCFKAKTAGGLNYAEEREKIEVGSIVMFARNTGQKIKIKHSDGDDRLVIMLTDTELMGVVTDPDKIRFWI